MKRFFRLPALALCLSIIALSMTVPVLTGCKSPTVQKKSVNTITTVGETVKFTLDGYLDLVVKGVLATNSVPTVMKAYGNYQAAYNASLTLVLGNTNAVPPQILQDAFTQFSTAVSTAKKELR